MTKCRFRRFGRASARRDLPIMPRPHAVAERLTTRGAALLSEPCATGRYNQTLDCSASVETDARRAQKMGKAVDPDLPYVRQDVPDDSEAPKVVSLRQAGKESRTPCHTACVQGHNCISVSGTRRRCAHSAGSCRCRSRVGASPDFACAPSLR